MQRLTFIMCAALAACSGSEPGHETTMVHPPVRDGSNSNQSMVDASPSNDGGTSLIVSKGCLAVRLKSDPDQITQLRLCEKIGWHVGLCETWESGITDGMDRCDSVRVEDRRRLEVEAECMTWHIPEEELEERFEAAMNCFYYRIHGGDLHTRV